MTPSPPPLQHDEQINFVFLSTSTWTFFVCLFYFWFDLRYEICALLRLLACPNLPSAMLALVHCVPWLVDRGCCGSLRGLAALTMSASFSSDRTQKYLYVIKLMASVDVLLIYTMFVHSRSPWKSNKLRIRRVLCIIKQLNTN